MDGQPDTGRVALRAAPARSAEWAPRVRSAARSAAIRRVGVEAGRAGAARSARTRPARRRFVHEWSGRAPGPRLRASWC